MIFKALSVVCPAGFQIANGEKTIETRRWEPDVLPLRDLLIIENEDRLSSGDMPADRNGRAVAIVDVIEVKKWARDELNAACASYWEDGWLGWKLANVRKIRSGCVVPAKLRIYEVELEKFEIEEE